MTLTTGQPIPDLTLAASGGRDIALRGFKGQKLVVYFYPKDDTPGCTLEGQDFTARYADFQAAGAEILGISRDSVAKHDKFAEKYGFPYPLLADTEEAACQAFDVLKEKVNYGKTYIGIDRSTFLFDADGRLVREWRGVKVPGHVDEVLEAVRAI